MGGAGARRCGQAQRERKDDCEKDENAGQLEVVRLPCPVRLSSTSSRKPQHGALIWHRHGPLWHDRCRFQVDLRLGVGPVVKALSNGKVGPRQRTLPTYLPKVDVPRPPPPPALAPDVPTSGGGGGTYVRAERPNVRWATWTWHVHVGTCTFPRYLPVVPPSPFKGPLLPDPSRRPGWRAST